MISLQWLPILTQIVGLKADEQFWSSWTKLQNLKISPQMKISQIFTDRYNNTEKFKALSNNTMDNVRPQEFSCQSKSQQ